MNNQLLKQTIHQLFANNKGLLAMDESTGTCNKRFAAASIPQTIEMRRKYRDLIVTTPGLNESIGGAILYDETIRQQTDDGRNMADVLLNAGIIPGIKLDKGAKPLAGFQNEKITEGLDGLRERIVEYKTMGARFAKWRAVISISDLTPTRGCLYANVQALARYAALCQEAGIVPIVEPEVLMNGNHTIQKCYDVTMETLKILFYNFYRNKIEVEGMILKPNMVIEGLDCYQKNSADEVANATINCLLNSVPAAMPAIAFLSGGQTPLAASSHLNAMHKIFKNKLPWIVSFSFARAIQQPALEAWKGKDENIKAAQHILFHRAKCDRFASMGLYNSDIENNMSD